MYGKIFQQMYDGTLGTNGPWEALVTFQQLIVLADKDGCVDFTIPAIVRRTTIPQHIIEKGIAVLLLPDPDSRTPDDEGKRIVLLSEGRNWGWRIVNYAKYRAIRSDEERREYHRSYYHEVRKPKAMAASTDSQPDSNASISSIDSTKGISSKQKKKEEGKTGLLTQSDLVTEGVSESAARDWLAVRKSAKAPLTETAWNAVKTEAVKANLTIAEAVKIAAERGWRSFKADWLKDKNGATSGNSEMQDLFRRSL
jgi:hypothetical protein